MVRRSLAPAQPARFQTRRQSLWTAPLNSDGVFIPRRRVDARGGPLPQIVLVLLPEANAGIGLPSYLGSLDERRGVPAEALAEGAGARSEQMVRVEELLFGDPLATVDERHGKP